MESKDTLITRREKAFKMVNWYNVEINSIEKTGKNQGGEKVNRAGLENTKAMRNQRLNEINKITKQLESL